MVETAFRTCKTSHLEVRPVFVRTEANTRGHVLVVMLAYHDRTRAQKGLERLRPDRGRRPPRVQQPMRHAAVDKRRRIVPADAGTLTDCQRAVGGIGCEAAAAFSEIKVKVDTRACPKSFGWTVA
jgi:hypothetical protein